MKLRFRKNSLRLRVNQSEVRALAAGKALTEHISFPGNACLSYVLTGHTKCEPAVTYAGDVITVTAPGEIVQQWSSSNETGMYFEVPANGSALRVAIEKDLECVDGPPEEQDPDAFPRDKANC